MKIKYSNENKHLLITILITVMLHFGPVDFFRGEEGEKKIEMQKFLENIHKVLKKMMEINKQRESRKKDRNRHLLKLKVRKQIIQKLSNPYIRKYEHRIIKIRDTQSNQGGNKVEKQIEIPGVTQKSQKTDINRFLRQNPVLMPFRFPDIKQYLLKFSKAEQIEYKESTLPSSLSNPVSEVEYAYLEAVREWYIEFLKNMIEFWIFFRKFFIDNSEGFEYLKHNLCKGEIPQKTTAILIMRLDKNAVKGILEEFIGNNFKNSVGTELIIDPIGTEVSTKRYLLSYEVESKCGYETSFLLPSFSPLKSLCYNVSSLSSLGQKLYTCENYKLNLYFYKLQSCLGKFFKENSVSECKDIKIAVKKLEWFAKKWFRFANNIFRAQMMPVIMDMCYKRCMCSEAGIDIKCRRNNDVEEPPPDNLIVLFYNLLKDKMRRLIDEYDLLHGVLTEIFKKEKIVNNPSCPKLSGTLKTYIEKFLRTTEAIGITSILNDFKFLDELAQGCGNVGDSLCIFENGICKRYREGNCSIYSSSPELFPDPAESCKNDPCGCCMWVNKKCIFDCSKYNNGQECNNSLAGECIWLKDRCISISDYCASLPPPGKGILNTVLLKEIAYKLDKLESATYEFTNDIATIFIESSDNLFCAHGIFRSMWEHSNFHSFMETIAKYIDGKITEKDVKKYHYQILFNLTRIAPFYGVKIPVLEGKTYKNMKDFITGWIDKLNYLDYHFFFYFMSYKVDKCSGRIRDNATLIEWIKDQVNGVKYDEKFYECIYNKKEVRECLNTSYKTDTGEIESNYKELQGTINEFLNNIGDRIELSKLDEIVGKVALLRKKKLYEIWPEIKSICNNIILSRQEEMRIPLEKCENVIKLNLEDLKKLTSPQLTLEECAGNEVCKVCYKKNESVIGSSLVIFYSLDYICRNCLDNEQCKNIGRIVQGLLEDTDTTKIEFLKGKWNCLINMLEQKICNYEGIDEKFCKEIENKTMEEIIPPPTRDSHKSNLKTLLGIDTYNFLEEKIKKFIENPNITTVNCNDL